MAQRTTRTAFRTTLVAVAAACAGAIPVAAFGKAEGGVYIAGAGFTFQQAAERGLSKNPGGRRFFLLAVPPETDALMQTAAGGQHGVAARSALFRGRESGRFSGVEQLAAPAADDLLALTPGAQLADFARERVPVWR